MKLRKTTRTIVTVLLILVVFTSITIWHDRVPGNRDSDELFSSMLVMAGKAPELNHLFAQLDLELDGAFYVVGLESEESWPVQAARACYLDLVASKFQFKKGGREYSGGMSAYRYRSLEDFITLLEETEMEAPGFLAGMNASNWVVIPAHPTDTSMKLVGAILLIIAATFIATRVRGNN